MKNLFLVLAVMLAAWMSGCTNPQPGITKDQQTESLFPKGDLITNNNFSGAVWFNKMGETDTTMHVNYGNVTFDPGARTNWHSHPGGQLLFITEGNGYYQGKGQQARLLQKGDFVEIPPNVVH